MLSRLRAKERQQQKQQVTSNYPSTIQDLMLPVLPITPSPLSFPAEITEDQHTSASSFLQVTDNNDRNHPITIKDEKVEHSVHLSSPVLKTRKECSTTLMAKPIDRRREEVKERANLFNKRTDTSMETSSCSTSKRPSTTAIESVFDSGCHSATLTNTLPTIHNEEDLVESKSFIHHLDFNMYNQIEN